MRALACFIVANEIGYPNKVTTKIYDPFVAYLREIGQDNTFACIFQGKR